MTLETGYLSSRQVIEQSNGCQASGFATGRAARQISKIGVRRQGHTGMGLKILSLSKKPSRPKTLHARSHSPRLSRAGLTPPVPGLGWLCPLFCFVFYVAFLE